jgi:Protein of unknown function (DUF3307)
MIAKQVIFASSKLYLHVFITGLLEWIMMGLQYWPVAIIILVTHTLIDGWKSYRQNTVAYFLIDQLLHLLVIAVAGILFLLNGPMLYWHGNNSINNSLLENHNGAGFSNRAGRYFNRTTYQAMAR